MLTAGEVRRLLQGTQIVHAHNRVHLDSSVRQLKAA
jgi:hypothetical protein